eukprot:scaffold4198_cov69-Phaeocystis_antarctica.AAC.4
MRMIEHLARMSSLFSSPDAYSGHALLEVDDAVVRQGEPVAVGQLAVVVDGDLLLEGFVNVAEGVAREADEFECAARLP